jgi:hypothetical protein
LCDDERFVVSAGSAGAMSGNAGVDHVVYRERAEVSAIESA